MSSDLGGTISFQWQSRTGVNPYVDITGATSQNYDPPALSATTDFRRVTSSTVSEIDLFCRKAAVRVTAAQLQQLL